MPHCKNVYKEAQSSVDNLWIFKFGFIPYLKIIQIFFTKLIRATLTKALLKHSRFCLMGDASYFFQKPWASFCPGALLAESTDQHSFKIRLVVVVLEKGFWWRSYHLNVVEATLTTAWGKKGRKSVLKKVFLRYYMHFSSAEVILAQLKYAPDRAHGGGRGNDGRVTEQSWNGSGTSNSHSYGRIFLAFTLDYQTKQHIIFCGTLFSLFAYDPRRENENKLSNFIFCNLLLFNKYLCTFT